MLKKIFSLFVCAMMCLVSTNLVFADGQLIFMEHTVFTLVVMIGEVQLIIKKQKIIHHKQ